MHDQDDFNTFKDFSKEHYLLWCWKNKEPNFNNNSRWLEQSWVFSVSTPITICIMDSSSPYPQKPHLKVNIIKYQGVYNVDDTYYYLVSLNGGYYYKTLIEALDHVLKLFKEEGFKTKNINSIDFIKN